MKIFKIIGITFLVIGTLACNSGSDFQKFRKTFEAPGSEYQTVPFWVWNGEVTETMIDEQLEDFKIRGFGGVFIHPRYGLITEYASEEWYDLSRYAMKKARSLGMQLWLYDENSFPSGFAGGIVPAEMPSSYDQGQALKLHRQSRLDPDTTKEYLLIFRGREDITGISDSLKGSKGDFLLYEKIYFPVSEWYAGYSYVDLLKPGVTEKFIDATMSGYKEKMGGEFGKTVPGVFTDEPNIAPQGGSEVIRWTPDLFEQFEQRWGYRLEPHLISLIENAGDYKTVRHNYYQLLLELFIDRWSKPWFEYTEENNLLWTGHYWEHGWPSPHHGPDNMAMYAWHQVPGIDMLFNNWDARPDQFGSVRAVRELNSVGNQLGRKRKLSETYGASGWELTFEDMKRNGDWEYVLGVNLMNQHLSYQTLMGDRKHDFPQSFSYHAPWWKEYNSLADYYARLSFALSSGEQQNKVIVIEPTTTAWMHYALDEQFSDIANMDSHFTALLNLLESEQVEYDLGSENIIRDHGAVEDGNFRVGERGYSSVVIPEFMDNLNKETADLLEQFMLHGGTVLALSNPPRFIDGVQSEKCTEWPDKYPGNWLAINGKNDPRFVNYLLTEEFILVEQEGGNLFHQRRKLDNGQILFLVNSSKTESVSTRIIMQGSDLVKMDPFTGSIESYPCVVTSDIMSFDADIPPTGSLLLYLSNDELKTPKSHFPKWRGDEEMAVVEQVDVQPASENVINLDYCLLKMAGDTSDLIYFYDAQTRIFNAHGFPKNPWVSSSQYKTSIIDRDTFSQGTGFEVTFPFRLDGETVGLKLRLVVERPDLYSVSVNENIVESIPGEWWLDRNFGTFEISDYLRPGENNITLKADPMSVFCELEPIYLLGNFKVMAIDKGWVLGQSSAGELGSWRKQGYPFYSDKMVYSSDVRLGGRNMTKIVLPDWKGTVAVVKVNGKRAGQVFTSPGELRVDELVKRGKNKIEVEIIGSLKNLLGPHHNFKTPGIVTPWSFKYAPAKQPSGLEYNLLDYGLMEPFQVITAGK